MTFDRNILKLFYLLLAADAAFIVLHLIHHWNLIPLSLLPDAGPERREALLSMLRLDRDRSYAEVFQYLKLGWLVLLMGWLMLKRDFLVCVGWVLLFLFFLFDDALGLHEHVGAALARHPGLTTVMGLRAQDMGELAFIGLAAGLILPLIALGYRLAAPDRRVLPRRLFMAMVLLGICGVGADMAHQALPGGLFWVIVEDGGEMLAISLALTLVLETAFASPLGATAARQPVLSPPAGLALQGAGGRVHTGAGIAPTPV